MEAKEVSGEVFNIGCGGRVSLNRLVDQLERILQSRLSRLHHAPRKGDVRHSFADVSKAERRLSYRPQVGFEQGLSRTMDYWRIQGQSN